MLTNVNIFVPLVYRANAWGQDKFGGQFPVQPSYSRRSTPVFTCLVTVCHLLSATRTSHWTHVTVRTVIYTTRRRCCSDSGAIYRCDLLFANEYFALETLYRGERSPDPCYTLTRLSKSSHACRSTNGSLLHRSVWQKRGGVWYLAGVDDRPRTDELTRVYTARSRWSRPRERM